jgi:hypothetical protein
MSDHADHRATVILSRAWKDTGSELAFVTRSVAGAASRANRVQVIVPSPAGPTEPDGAFDLFGAGGEGEPWPSVADASWPSDLPRETTIIVDDADPTALALLDHFGPGQPVHGILTEAAPADRRSVTPLAFTGTGGEDHKCIGLHVPINPMAANHRHNGLGFTGYLLVLTDRTGTPDVVPPTAMVAWLTARFPTMDIVVVEDATAAVWRARVLRGQVSVYTRTDLWRLLAHARVTIDLAPGRIIARECIESLRFGTPIVVPAGSTARPHADAGGGMAYCGYSELLDCVTQLGDDRVRATMSSCGRDYADAHYGDQAAFVAGLTRILGAPLSPVP